MTATGADLERPPAAAPSRADPRRRSALPIWLKLSVLTAAGLLSLVGSAWIFSDALRETSQRTQRMGDLLDYVEVAGEAQAAFGEMRYWLTDLSVSLLTASERNAEAARANLEAELDILARVAPDDVAQIRGALDAYVDKALEAADAYTDDRRVIGNTMLSQARVYSARIDTALRDVVARVDATAQAERAAVVERSDVLAERALYLVAALAVLGLGLTVLVLRSIVVPLRRLNDTVAALMSGRRDVEMPPEGPDELGAMAHTLRLFRDSMSERERLQAIADEQRQRVATAIEAISEGFVLFDPSSRIVIVNTQYLRLFPEMADTARPGATFRDLLEAQLQACTVDTGGLSDAEWIAGRLAAHAEPETLVEERRYGDRWVRIAKRETPDGGKVAVYTDITEAKAREAELDTARRAAETASEAKSQFLASMSHELRTPLNAIIGYSEMLIEEADDRNQTEIVPDLNKVAGAGQHLLMLINDILDLSKIEAGKMEVFVEDFSLSECISSVQDTIRPLMDKNANALTVDVPDDIGMASSDQTKIRQSLFNLLSNAAKFTENGTVALSARRQTRPDGDWLRLAVTDSGIGMTDEQCARLFQAFSQADASTTRNYGGTGLGLNITRSFCEMIGGSITVESALGQGSTFTIEIPAVCPQPEAEPPAEAQPLSEADGYVLIIDDDPGARRIIREALAAAGYATREAASGAQGVRIARERRPRAIILDIIMPGQDGWAVLKALKGDPVLCHIPVILASVLADRNLGIALGAVEYLTKPIDAGQLVSAIRAHGDGARDVLVVDDDPISRNLIRRILSKEGARVHEAGDGQVGLEMMRSLRPHLVVLDLMMPNMDGFQVLDEMQRTPELEGTAVIVVSSKDLSGAERNLLREHAVSIVAKDANTRDRLVSALSRQISHTVPARG